MGTAILINKTFLTSEYKLNSRIRHHWIGLLSAFSSGSEQKSITHILYRFSVLSSIHICVVSMNLHYISCKFIDQYNMLIHSIFHIRNLRILISTEGTFHFVVYRKTDITGSLQIRNSFALFSYRKQGTILLFSHIFHGCQYSCPAIFSASIIGDYSPTEGVTFCVTPWLGSIQDVYSTHSLHTLHLQRWVKISSRFGWGEILSTSDNDFLMKIATL